MNPAALQYYRTWLQRRRSTRGLFLLGAILPFVAAVVLASYLHVRLGDWSMEGTLAGSALFIAVIGLAFIWFAQKAALTGGWTLFESLECGYRAGSFREVWREFMLKYPGLLPEIVASERFQRLFLAVGADIVAHEELTPDQSRWMDDLLSVVRLNLATPGGATSAESTAKFARPLMLAYAISATLFLLIKLFEVFSPR